MLQKNDTAEDIKTLTLMITSHAKKNVKMETHNVLVLESTHLEIHRLYLGADI